MSSPAASPSATAEVLIRTSPETAYESFVDPAKLALFWLARASAPLQIGKRVRWEFMVPGAVDDVEATTLDPAKQIVITSKDGTTTTWTFDPHDGGTVVKVVQSGFGDDAYATALEATQGFTMVLCALKMLLEHGDAKRIVEDKARLIRERKE